jgi:ubiquinol-cytochrome c reductase cytochrome c subunit
MTVAARVAGLSLLLALVCSSGAIAAAPQYADGAEIFAANCAVCHGSGGAGQPALAPPLLANPARYATVAEGRRQLALTVLFGMFGDITIDQKHYSFKMPEFSQLDDQKLAAVLNFVAFDLAHAAQEVKPIGADEIAAERGKGLDGAGVREHRAAVLEALGSG